MGQFIDLTGNKYGKLTVVKRVEDHIQKSGVPKAMWLCKCECGGERVAYGQALRAGKIIDCGCGDFERRSIQSTKNATTHGGSGTRLYRVWKAIRMSPRSIFRSLAAARRSFTIRAARTLPAQTSSQARRASVLRVLYRVAWRTTAAPPARSAQRRGQFRSRRAIHRAALSASTRPSRAR